MVNHEQYLSPKKCFLSFTDLISKQKDTMPICVNLQVFPWVTSTRAEDQFLNFRLIETCEDVLHIFNLRCKWDDSI